MSLVGVYAPCDVWHEVVLTSHSCRDHGVVCHSRIRHCCCGLGITPPSCRRPGSRRPGRML